MPTAGPPRERRTPAMKPAAKVYTALIMLFLFAPIAILLVFSFNSAKSLSVMQGFSLYWYRELFRDAETLSTVRNTLILALAASGRLLSICCSFGSTCRIT